MYQILENNIWGIDKDENFYAMQCVYSVEGGKYRGFFWDVDGCVPSIISYPEIYTGEKPFASSQLYKNTFLGKKINEYKNLNIYVDMNIFDYQGRFNIAAETWLIDPKTKNVITEFLIFLDDYGVQPYGSFLDIIYDQYDNPWNIYTGPRAENDLGGWDIISIQPNGFNWCEQQNSQSISCKGTIDFKHMLFQLKNLNLVDLNLQIDVLEIGVEIAGGSDCENGQYKGFGTALFNQVDFNIL